MVADDSGPGSGGESCRGAEGCASCPDVLNRGRGAFYRCSSSSAKHGHHKSIFCPVFCLCPVQAIDCKHGCSKLTKPLYVNSLHGEHSIAGWAIAQGPRRTKARTPPCPIKAPILYMANRAPHIMPHMLCAHFSVLESGTELDLGDVAAAK